MSSSGAAAGHRRGVSAPTTGVVTGVRETFRIRLQASSLPRQKLGAFRRGAIPDTYAVVTSINNRVQLSPLSRGAAAAGYVWGKTEVIKKSFHPHWTKAINIDFEPDKQLLFYVHIFQENKEGDEASSAAFSASTTEDNPVSASGPVDYSNSLGAAVFSSDILQTQHCTRVKRLRGGGLVFCRLERIQEQTDDLSQRFKFQLGARNLILPNNRYNPRKTNAIVEFSKFSTDTQGKSTGAWVTIHRSNVAQTTTGRPIWDPASVDLGTLCNGDLEKPIRITVLSVKKSGIPGLSSGATTASVIGMAETNLRCILRRGLAANSHNTAAAMAASPPEIGNGDDHPGIGINDDNDDVLGANELYLQRSVDKRKIVGRLCVISATTETTSAAKEEEPLDAGAESWANGYNGTIEEVVDLAKLQPVAPPAAAPSTDITTAFQRYIELGCELEFSVAIDFTSSNGDPQFEDSLHYQSEDTFNDYEETIVAVGKAIDAYSKTQQYAVWGFGAKFAGTVRHLFQCGPEALVKGVDGILGAYKSVFHNDLIMSGPTILLNILQAAAVQSRKIHENQTPSSLRYNVLLIITDGSADELEETRRKLVLYSFLPLSVVIVGLGKEDFSLMYQLDDQPLPSGAHGGSSTNATRTNTSFVEFRKHQHNPIALGQAALREVPAQLCEYMKSRSF